MKFCSVDSRVRCFSNFEDINSVDLLFTVLVTNLLLLAVKRKVVSQILMIDHAKFLILCGCLALVIQFEDSLREQKYWCKDCWTLKSLANSWGRIAFVVIEVPIYTALLIEQYELGGKQRPGTTINTLPARSLTNCEV